MRILLSLGIAIAFIGTISVTDIRAESLSEKDGLQSHYLCRIVVDDNSIGLAKAKKVQGPLPERRAPYAVPKDFRFRLNGPEGKLLHEGAFGDPRDLHLTYADLQGNTRHAGAQERRGSVLLRLPYCPAGSLLTVEKRQVAVKEGKSEVNYQPFSELKIDISAKPGEVRR